MFGYLRIIVAKTSTFLSWSDHCNELEPFRNTVFSIQSKDLCWWFKSSSEYNRSMMGLCFSVMWLILLTTITNSNAYSCMDDIHVFLLHLNIYNDQFEIINIYVYDCLFLIRLCQFNWQGWILWKYYQPMYVSTYHNSKSNGPVLRNNTI